MIKNPRIFCMDKNPKSLRSLVYLLRTEKYYVLAASTVDKAFEIIQKEQQLDMVIVNSTNIHQADTPAGSEEKHEKEFQIAATVRGKFGNIPILFVVPLLRRKAIEKFASLKNSKLLFLPYEPSYFLYVVKNGLAGRYLSDNL